MDDVIAGRQHDVRGRAALLADQLEGAGVVGLVGEHPPHQPAVDDRQILAVARRQRQHRLAWRCGARRRRRRRDVAIDGGTMVGCVSGGGRVGPGPDGGARFIAGPVWRIRNRGRRHRRRAVLRTSGPKPGPEAAAARTKASASRRERPPAPPAPADAIAAPSHGHAFHRKRGKFKPPERKLGRHR